MSEIWLVAAVTVFMEPKMLMVEWTLLHQGTVVCPKMVYIPYCPTKSEKKEVDAILKQTNH